MLDSLNLLYHKLFLLYNVMSILGHVDNNFISEEITHLFQAKAARLWNIEVYDDDGNNIATNEDEIELPSDFSGGSCKRSGKGKGTKEVSSEAHCNGLGS